MKILSKILLYFISVNYCYSQYSTIFLIDNSGSMSGYYREQNSNFKTFCNVLIKNYIHNDEDLYIMLFSKTDLKRNLKSPNLIFSGKGNEFIKEKFNENFILQRGSDNEFGNTDLIEAIDSAVKYIKSEIGVIWLITDNINDVSGKGDSSFFNTLLFYKKLKTDDNFRKILLFPIPEKITELNNISYGYVAYAIVYSRKYLNNSLLDYFDNRFRNTRVQQKALTLKPLDIGTIRILPSKVSNRIYPGKLLYDGKTLRGYDFEENENLKEVFNDLNLKSNLFPYLIKTAKLSVKLENFKSTDYSVTSLGNQIISPSTINNVSPEGIVTGFSLVFNIQGIKPEFSLNTIFRDNFTLNGKLILEVTDVEILLDENYIKNFKELFALNSVPEIFKPDLNNKKIITEIPIEIQMRYGNWRIFILIGVLIFISIIILSIIFLLMNRKHCIIQIDSKEEIFLSLNFFSKKSLCHNTIFEIGYVYKSFFNNIKFKYSNITNNPGLSIVLIEGVPVEVSYRDEFNNNVVLNLVLKELIRKRKDTIEMQEKEYY